MLILREDTLTLKEDTLTIEKANLTPKQARLTLGLNKTEMARAMGVHRNLWYKWECGERRISAAPMRLMKALLFMQARDDLIDFLSLH